MNTRKTSKIATLAAAAFTTGMATATVVDCRQDNVDIAVSDNYRTVFNKGVTFRAEPAAEKDGKADISWVVVGGENPGATAGTGNYPADGITVPVEVPADAQLTIGRIDGGRALEGSPHKLVKTGAGKLVLDEARCFGGTVKVNAGTLAMEKRAIPTALPEGALVHFDFSQEDTITKDAEGNVSSVANLGTATCTLTQSTEALRPIFVSDVPSTGLSGLDFGKDQTLAGRYLSFAPAQTLATVLVVVDSRIYSTMHFLDGSFRCLNDWVDNYSSWYHGYARFKSATAAWVNGLPIKVATEFYEAPGFNVVALEAPANTVKLLGGLWTNNYGGMRLFEVVGYDHALTDLEVRDASALLMKKWLNRTAPGYADALDVADLQSVTAAGGATLDVASGTTEKIGALALEGPVAKTGAGTLEVTSGTELETYLTVRAGAVVAGEASDVAGNCEIAKLPTLHLDASNANLVKTFANNGTNFVWCWQDTSGIISAQKPPTSSSWGVNYTYPWYNTDADALCNGLPVVDFGPRAPRWSNTVGAQISLSRSVQNARAVYFVMGSQAGGGNVLGSGTPDMDSNLYGRKLDFYRGEESGGTANRPLFASACTAVLNGELFINGVKQAKVNGYVPNGGYELVELHTTAGCAFSVLGNGFEGYLHGGFRLGEIVVFERPLSDRERVATRNYLMKKWFAKADLDSLPEKPAVAALAVRAIAPDVTASIGGDVSAAMLSGTGTVETANHTLTVKDISGFTGKVKVDGELVLNGKQPAVTPELVTDGRILHLDACEGVTTITNSDGSVVVESWNSKLGDGWVAMPGPAYLSVATTNRPAYLPAGLNAKPVVKMAASGQQHFLFCRNGVTNRLTNIASVFWVIGSQEGGGFLLGGGSTGVSGSATTGQPYVSGYTWHRGGSSAGSTASEALLSGNSPDAITYGAWRVDGTSVKPKEAGLSGDYDVVSFVKSDNYPKNVLDADGLAFDGRYLVNLKDYSGRPGHQRIAELIVYDRRLSADEVAKVEAYLQAKWGFAQQSATNAAQVEVASGATVTCPTPQYVGTLSGAGTVTGDVTVKNFVLDGASNGLTINGTLTIAESPVLTIKSFGTGNEFVLATATAYAGTENLKNATIVGGRAKLRIKDGKLIAKRLRGTIIVFR